MPCRALREEFLAIFFVHREKNICTQLSIINATDENTRRLFLKQSQEPRILRAVYFFYAFRAFCVDIGYRQHFLAASGLPGFHFACSPKIAQHSSDARLLKFVDLLLATLAGCLRQYQISIEPFRYDVLIGQSRRCSPAVDAASNSGIRFGG